MTMLDLIRRTASLNAPQHAPEAGTIKRRRELAGG